MVQVVSGRRQLLYFRNSKETQWALSIDPDLLLSLATHRDVENHLQGQLTWWIRHGALSSCCWPLRQKAQLVHTSQAPYMSFSTSSCLQRHLVPCCSWSWL